MPALKIIVVDDNHTFLEGLIYYIDAILGHQVIEYANSKAEYLEIKNVHEADFVLMDIDLPDGNGIEILKSQYIDIKNSKFIAITNHQEKAYLDQMLASGFRGCVFKDNIYNELQLAFNTLLKGEMYFSAVRNLSKKP